MRYNARYETGWCGSAASPGPASSGKDWKGDLISLLPGGETLDAEPASAWLPHGSSPEPVNGLGGMKGIFAYYAAVRYYETLAE